MKKANPLDLSVVDDPVDCTEYGKSHKSPFYLSEIDLMAKLFAQKDFRLQNQTVNAFGRPLC